MTRAFVADASVAIAWVHPAQATPQTDAMLDAVAEGAVLEVPALWPLEVANALTVLVRRIWSLAIGVLVGLAGAAAGVTALLMAG